MQNQQQSLPPVSLRPLLKPNATFREFYEKPYATCKDCMSSKFKCKACLDDLIVKLRGLREQKEQSEKRKRVSIQQSYKSIKQALQEEGQQRGQSEEQQFRLTVLKKVGKRRSPVLHRKVIEVPLIAQEKPEVPFPPNPPACLIRLEHKRVTSLGTQNSIQIEENKVAVRTLEVPDREKDSLMEQVMRIDHRARANKPKINYPKEKTARQYQSDTMLPSIRQLNMAERDLKKDIIISKPTKKKPTKEQQSIPKPKQSFKQTPNHLSGWQQSHLNDDFFYQ